jgi:hypothetical protein
MAALRWLLDWWVHVVSWRFGWVIPVLLGLLVVMCGAQVVLERVGPVLKGRVKSEKEDADGGG